MSRFATSTLIFAVLKLGLLNITEEIERMTFAFLFACIFLSDFVSYWFQVYSSYLLDEESHKTPNAVVQMVLLGMKSPLVSLAMTVLAEMFTYSYYISFFPTHFTSLTSHPMYPLVLKLAIGGAIVKNLHNVTHLLVSSIRIVKLDV